MSPLVRFMIFSTVFVKGGAFLSLPFLSVYLQKNFGASPAMTGLIVGLNPAAGLVMSFAGGYLSDVWGRKGILLLSTFLCGISYFLFAVSSEVWHFALVSIILGSASGAMQTSLRALISDLTAPAIRPRAFRLIYFAINVGASVGPLVGAVLLMKDFTVGFAITGSLYFLYFFTFILFNKLTHNPVYEETKTKVSFFGCVNILKNDNAFLIFVCGSLLLSLTYSQIETLLPQYLRNISGDAGIRTFSWLLAANSVTVMLGLYPATLAAKKLGAVGAIVWGQILMSIAFAIIPIFGTSVPAIMTCMILLTIGEILAFSNMSIVLDSYAKPGLKGSYFGASSFFMIGNSLGPLLGGFFYQSGGAYVAFLLLGLISFSGSFCYLRAERLRAPQHIEVLV